MFRRQLRIRNADCNLRSNLFKVWLGIESSRSISFSVARKNFRVSVVHILCLFSLRVIFIIYMEASID